MFKKFIVHVFKFFLSSISMSSKQKLKEIEKQTWKLSQIHHQLVADAEIFTFYIVKTKKFAFVNGNVSFLVGVNLKFLNTVMFKFKHEPNWSKFKHEIF